MSSTSSSKRRSTRSRSGSHPSRRRTERDGASRMSATTRARTATNGAARARVGSFAAAGMPYDDPMSKVLGLDAKTSSLAAWLGFGSGGTLLFVGLTALVLVVAWWHTVQLHKA